eukprot:scaffold36226_cov18-Tisochrysis_lutea.AAC.1
MPHHGLRQALLLDLKLNTQFVGCPARSLLGQALLFWLMFTIHCVGCLAMSWAQAGLADTPQVEQSMGWVRCQVIHCKAMRKKRGARPLTWPAPCITMDGYWFELAFKVCKRMFSSNSDVWGKVLKADVHLHPCTPSCWTAALSLFQLATECKEDRLVVHARRATDVIAQWAILATSHSNPACSPQQSQQPKQQAHATSAAHPEKSPVANIDKIPSLAVQIAGALGPELWPVLSGVGKEPVRIRMLLALEAVLG